MLCSANLGQQGKWESTNKWKYPKYSNNADGSVQPCHGVWDEGVADGEVPFHGERHNC